MNIQSGIIQFYTLVLQFFDRVAIDDSLPRVENLLDWAPDFRVVQNLEIRCSNMENKNQSQE